MDPAKVLQVRFPHERHGNGGKTSNHAKTTVKNDFLQFVDNNTQPDGRSADSSGPTFYFTPSSQQFKPQSHLLRIMKSIWEDPLWVSSTEFRENEAKESAVMGLLITG